MPKQAERSGENCRPEKWDLKAAIYSVCVTVAKDKNRMQVKAQWQQMKLASCVPTPIWTELIFCHCEDYGYRQVTAILSLHHSVSWGQYHN
jgi:hypothetical protein